MLNPMTTRRDGSSPHTRGTPLETLAVLLECRFIPAYAGNAENAINKGSVKSVHPRIRGEREELEALSPSEVGSSPHTRGTRRVIVKKHHQPRFIPAYAGNAPLVT